MEKPCAIFYFRFVGYGWHDVKQIYSQLLLLTFRKQLRPRKKLFHDMNETPQQKEKDIGNSQNSQVTSYY